jgi:C4-dicarboxylate-specific signal transduction histidine kinase
MVEKDLREVAFLGRITAAFTHEMKNVLAIIKESAGLMEDLLSLGQETAFPYRERFVRCLTSIQAQTKRGVELSGRLNRLAHSPDEEVARVDLNDILDQVIILSGRMARLKGVSLQLHPHGEPLNVVLSPLRLQMVVFICLECCWGTMASGGTISLSVTLDGLEAIVRFCCQNGGDGKQYAAGPLSEGEAKQVIQELVTSLDCRIAWCASPPAFELILPVDI